MAEIAVGIDLGTSNSCVAVTRGRQVEVLTNAYGENTTASVVNLGGDGSITVGNAAKANIIHDPSNTIYSAKRLIGRYFFSEEVKKARAICSYEIIEGEGHSVRIKVREESFSLPEAAAMVLRELKSIAEARLGQPVEKAVITVPAYFNDNQRQATRDAGRIAGLEVLRILNEPTAAALAYGFGRNLKQRVAVYDLGGGTFDISVLEIGDDVFEVLSTSGDTFLGGDDFDDRLIDLLADEFVAKEGINLRGDPFALEKLKVAAEDCKKAFSEEDEAEIRIPDIITAPDGSTRSIERRIDKTEFWSLVQDLVLRTFKVCDEALQAAGVVARDLDGVILVGGPTRMPAIRDAVQEYFQQEPREGVDPDEVVAMGAAIHAASFVEETTSAYLLDVTPLSLQVGLAGGLCETVIERNTPVPIEQSRSFTTARDGQTSVKIKIYQGESREAGENELLGQFEFSGFDPAKRGQVAIDVAFQINTDGIVNVTASDRTTGRQASTRITLSSGLSEQEIQSIEQRGVTERVRTDEPAAAAAPSPAPSDELKRDERDLEGEALPELDTGDGDALLPLGLEVDASTPPPGADEPDSLFGDGSDDLRVDRDDDMAVGSESPPGPDGDDEITLPEVEPAIERALGAPDEGAVIDASGTALLDEADDVVELDDRQLDSLVEDPDAGELDSLVEDPDAGELDMRDLDIALDDDEGSLFGEPDAELSEKS